jgi:DNA replication protein DnaC
MDTSKTVEQLTQTASQKTRQISSETIALFLERNGWKKEVAGADDFDKVVKALKMAYENQRGIFVAGAPGCGKTALLKCLQKNYKNNIFLYCKDKEDIEYMKRKCVDEYVCNIFIDDLGCEEIMKEYGNTIDVVGDFIQYLHNRFKGYVFISSNNGLKWMNERYGGRVMDRVLDMCVCFQMSGSSNRERMVL